MHYLEWYNLQKKRWKGSDICVLCRQGEETMEHIFIKCTYAIKIWKIVYNLGGHQKHVRKIEELWRTIKPHKYKKDKQKERVCSCIWHLWIRRNKECVHAYGTYG